MSKFILYIYVTSVIIFYIFGVINYVSIKMNFSKKSVKSWLKKKLSFILEKMDPQFYESVINQKHFKMIMSEEKDPVIEQILFSDIFVVYRAQYGTLAWKVPWMEKPGRLLSMGLCRV